MGGRTEEANQLEESKKVAKFELEAKLGTEWTHATLEWGEGPCCSLEASKCKKKQRCLGNLECRGKGKKKRCLKAEGSQAIGSTCKGKKECMTGVCDMKRGTWGTCTAKAKTKQATK